MISHMYVSIEFLTCFEASKRLSYLGANLGTPIITLIRLFFCIFGYC
jgi:hypothetical protein